MRPFLIPDSIRDLRVPYPSASCVLQAAAGGRIARADLVQLWITEGIPYAFKDCPGIYASMRAWMAARLRVHPKRISMTGSGRFGESWVPSKLGTPFGPHSDLDLFVVSGEFFARIQDDFLRWSNEYRRGEVTPRTRREATYWDDHQGRGPRIIRRGFLDARMIPTWHRYETGKQVEDTMWRLKRKLASTPSAPVVRDASVRVYRDMNSLVDQESMNLYHATKQVGNKRASVRATEPES